MDLCFNFPVSSASVEHLLRDVGVKVEWLYRNVSPIESALQQAPEILYAVRVNMVAGTTRPGEPLWKTCQVRFPQKPPQSTQNKAKINFRKLGYISTNLPYWY
jgi:hypothetical protein